MNPQLLLGLLFAMSPIMELRGAIPLIVEYGLRTNTPYHPFIILAIGLNILTILLVLLFLELLHHYLLEWKVYKKLWDKWVHNKLRKKIDKLEKKEGIAQYLLLLLFIAIPIPGTGVWTSTTISWILGMNKKKSFITIAIGATIAGIIILLLSEYLLLGIT